MTLFDICILCFLLYQVFKGLKRGLIRIIFDITALFSGIHFGIKYYEPLSIKLISIISISTLQAKFISFICIWIGIFMLVSTISKWADKLIKPSFMSSFNRLGGAVFGLTKGVVLLFPIIMIMVFLNTQAIQTSKVVRPVIPIINSTIHKIYPETVQVPTQLQKFLKARAQKAS